MKKLIISLITLFSLGLLVKAQTAPNLIISEIFMGLNPRYAYAEIANIGTDTVKLSEIFIVGNTNNAVFHNAGHVAYSLRLDDSRFLKRVPGDKLAPGQAALIVTPFTGLNVDLDTIQTTPNFYLDNADIITQPMFEGVNCPLRFYGGDDAMFLLWDKNGNGIFDYTRNVDLVLDAIGTSSQYNGVRQVYDIAGVSDAALDHVIIRKANVIKGNDGYFLPGTGTGPEDSEYIVIPWDPRRITRLLATAGYHGSNFTFSLSSPVATIGENSATIPWGTLRDGIYKILDFGPNEAWDVKWGPDTLNSNLAQNKDTLVVYLVGNDIQTKKYSLSIAPPLANMNLLFPRVELIDQQNVSTFPDYTKTFTRRLISRYSITQLEDAMDTIGMSLGFTGGGVPYGTRVETLLEFTEIAPNANIKFIPFDGITRTQMMTGDKFEVTAMDQSTREYYVIVEPKVINNNVLLTNILLDNEPLPGFNLRRGYYQVTLSPDAVSFPAITAFAQSQTSVVTIDRPVNLRGSLAERTAKINVVGENTLYEKTYTIVFNLTDDLQPNKLDPIISEIKTARTNSWAGAFEIANIGNVPIDLSEYLIVGAVTTQSAEALITDTTFINKLRPGYKIDRTRSGTGIFFNPVSTNYSIVIDPGEVFVISSYSHPFKTRAGDQVIPVGNSYDTVTYYERVAQFVDYFAQDNDPNSAENANHYTYTDGWQICQGVNVNKNYSLWKIINDSIFNGTKSANKVTDYQLIDVFGGVGIANNTLVQGTAIAPGNGESFFRNPEISKGNPLNFGSYGNNPVESEWNILSQADVPESYMEYRKEVGNHDFIPSTDFSSTVSSHVYVVSKGYSLSETLDGVSSNTAVGSFLANIIKENINQNLSVVSGTSGAVLGAEVKVKAGDILKVTSADGKNHTSYLIALGALSNDALLTSSTYTINVGATTGTISGIPAMKTLKEVLENITVPSTVSQFSIIDDNNNQIPEEVKIPNTLITIPALADNAIKFEVIAEDGKTKILYSLLVDEGDPFITSAYYDIIQSRKIIDRFNGGSIGGFLANVKLSSGATLQIVDILGFEKTNSYDPIYIDDQVIVSNGSKSVTYIFNAYGVYIMSNISSLSALSATIGTFEPSFDPEILSYNLVVPVGTTSLAITATKEDALATVIGDGTVTISGDTTKVEIVVTAENGETSAYRVAITISTVGVPDFESGSVSIYPNPFASEFHINLGKYQSGVTVKMTNALGKEVLIKTESSSEIRVGTEGLPSGLYFVTISKGDKSVTKKIVKQ